MTPTFTSSQDDAGVCREIAAFTIAAFAWPLFVWIKRKLTPTQQAAAAE
jgi:hypothetical protein